ncbi:MAG: hypothetical protein HOW73_29215 [Polyangiaceae bacterium]|nr:hypothetical protein [Polyangiaceae bacterium]
MTSMRFLSVMFAGAIAFGGVACGDDTGTGANGGGPAGGSDQGGGGGTGGTPVEGGGGGTGGTPVEGGGGAAEGGAGGGAESFNLEFSGTGFPHDDQTLYVSVRDANGTEVAADSAVVAGGAFSFTFENIAAEGGTVDYYADGGEVGVCEAPSAAGDHAWRKDIPANHVLEVAHDGNWTDVCASFE